MTDDQVRDTLRRAKEVLLERGWWRTGFAEHLDGSGAVCLLGACSVALYGDPFYGQLSRGSWSCVRDILAEQPEVTTDPATWNDSFAQSIDDVIGLIDRAIASLPVQEPVHA